MCVFVCCRVKKLKETLVTVQQLDKNMSNLRSWLSRIEAELSRPITYSVCHHQEIERRLAEQQVRRNAQPHISVHASPAALLVLAQTVHQWLKLGVCFLFFKENLNSFFEVSFLLFD